MPRTIFKSRGHFCNYCRKIVWNKIKDTPYHSIGINEAIWFAWDNPEVRDQFLADLIALDVSISNKNFNSQLKAINKKYK